MEQVLNENHTVALWVHFLIINQDLDHVYKSKRNGLAFISFFIFMDLWTEAAVNLHDWMS